MNASTLVGRGRPRARFALLSLSTILCSGLAAPALAQMTPPAPVRQSVDANGVDLFAGTMNVDAPSVSIGQGDVQGLSYHQVNRGAGWTDNITVALNRSGTFMTVSLGETTDRFTVSGTTYGSTEGNGATLTFDGSTQLYTYIRADGTVVHFSKTRSSPAPYYASEGRVTDMKLPSGTKLVYAYDNLHYCRTTQPREPDVCRTYADAYRVSMVTSSYGYRMSFGYAQVGYDPDTPSNLPDFRAWSTPTSASLSNLVQSGAASSEAFGFSTSGGVTTFSVTDPLNRTTTFRMSGGAVAGITRPGSSSEDVTVEYANGRVNSVATPVGSWTYAMSEANGERTVTVTDPTSRPTTYVFDVASQLMKSTTDALGHATLYDHDASGRVTKVTAPEQNSIEYAYDGRGNVTRATAHAKPGSNQADVSSSASYAETCTSVVTCNQPTSTTDANSNATDYTYDETHGGVLTATGAAPTQGAARPQVRYGYTAFTDYLGGTVYRQTSASACRTQASCAGTADEVVTSTDYGSVAANNLLPLSTSTGAGDGSLTATSSMTYDAIGNLTAVNGPLPGGDDTTNYSYDAARQQTMVIAGDPDGSGPLKRQAATVHHLPNGLIDSQSNGTVDSNGTFSAAQVLSTGYDAAWRKTSDRLTAGGTTFGLTQYGYDAAGRPVCQVVRMNPALFSTPSSNSCVPESQAGPDGSDRVTQLGYDQAGQVTATATAFGTPQASTETATYTANGKVEYVTDGNGNRTRFIYDGRDRLSQMNMPDPAKPGQVSSTDYQAYLYDANGNVTYRRTRAGQEFRFGFDGLNRVTSKTVPAGMRNVSYDYDLLGHPTEAHFARRPGDDPAVNPDAVVNVYDPLGRVVTSTTTMDGVSRTLGYQHDLLGDQTQITHPDGVHFDTGYDALGRMKNASWTAPGVGTVPFVNVTYDDLGRRKDFNRASSFTGYAFDAVGRLGELNQRFAGNAGNVNAGFAYNPAGQISGQTRDSDDYAFTGSSNGNRAYGVNGLNQLTSINGAPLTYDANGNLTSDGKLAYAYDAENRMVSASNGTTLTYDPLGRLWQTASPTYGKTQFLYDGVQVAAEYDGDTGTMRRRYMFGPGMDEPVLWDEGSSMNCSATRFLHPDERGSIVALANCAGVRVAANAYDEYGNPKSENQGRFGYTGQAWLPDVGLWFYKARMYSPSLGRFMQTDPIGYADGINWYGYVGGDPINVTDPSGLATDCSTEPCEVVVPGKRLKLNDPFTYSFSPGDGGANFGLQSRFQGAYSTLLEALAPEPKDVVVTARKRPNKAHRYVIQQNTVCSASGAFEKMRAPGVSAPGAPYARSGTTPLINLPINNPIAQSVNPATRTIRNVTLEGHSFYPGNVTIQVDPRAGGGSTITITGEGTGPNPGLNDAAGYAIFGFASRSVALSCAGQPVYTPVRGG